MKPFINKQAGYKSVPAYRLYYLLFIVLVVTSVYSCKSNNNSEQKQTGIVIDTAAINRDTLQSQLALARYQLDQYMSKAADLDAELHGKDDQIAELTKELKRYRNSSNTFAAELKKAKNLVASLKEKVKDFEDHIASLQNDSKQILADKDNLQKKYDDLKALGSVLHASNIRIAALHFKHNGREKKTARARRVNEFRMRFDIDENRIAEDGTKKLYIAIKGPHGNMLGNNALGSGTTSLFNGNSVNYSIEKNIALKQNEAVKDVTVDWKQDGTYEKGTYEVEIYNGGYPIGEGTVALR